MEVFKSQLVLSRVLFTHREKGFVIGFVPTMGALHKGHISLIKEAKEKCDYVVCSIFVNPTQFNNKEDLTSYPVTIKEDIALLESVSCDGVFLPEVKEIYPKGELVREFDFGGIEKQMEGAFRTGHFEGVGTVVGNLFDIVKPHVAFFGEKDFQQLQIIKKLVELEKRDVEIVGCSIFREEDGLAMSSRNKRLSEIMRKEAPLIYKILKEVQNLVSENIELEKINKYVESQFKESLLELEYFSISDIETLKTTNKIENSKQYRAFIAAYANDVRLIDNIVI